MNMVQLFTDVFGLTKAFASAHFLPLTEGIHVNVESAVVSTNPRQLSTTPVSSFFPSIIFSYDLISVRLEAWALHLSRKLNAPNFDTCRIPNTSYLLRSSPAKLEGALLTLRFSHTRLWGDQLTGPEFRI